MTVRLVNKSDKLILLEIYDLSEVHQVDVRQEDWPVQGDGEEVEDGGGAAEDVAGGPHVTQERPEDPGATYLNQGKVGQLFYLITDEGKVQIN